MSRHEVHCPPPRASPAWADLAGLLTEQEPPCRSFAEMFAACSAYAEAAAEPWGVWAGIDRGRRTRPEVSAS